MKKWPADRVERKSVESLVPYARNARTHSDEQIAQVADSIQRYGFTVPVLADEAGNIIAGHCRVMAARRLGLVDVPVMTAEGWSEAERRAYTLIDNKLSLNADWDEDLLRAEFSDIEGLGFDLGALGFNPTELAAIRDMRPAGLTDPDEAPALPAEPIATTGDLWALGRHWLLCGDAIKAEDTRKVLDAKPHLMVTDPPYGVDYDPDWRNHAKRDGILEHTIGATAIGKSTNDDRVDWREAWALFPGDVAYCWHAGRYASKVQASFEHCGFEVISQIIWAKDRLIISRGDYHWQHEPCWYLGRKGKPHRFGGDRSQTTLWQIGHRASETGHGAQKPIECMQRPIENNSRPGDAVYDPFVGSGTTIIAAEMTARVCCAIEINPAYVDVSILRWQNFTGEQAKLGKKTFAQISKERKRNARSHAA